MSTEKKNHCYVCMKAASSSLFLLKCNYIVRFKRIFFFLNHVYIYINTVVKKKVTFSLFKVITIQDTGSVLDELSKKKKWGRSPTDHRNVNSIMITSRVCYIRRNYKNTILSRRWPVLLATRANGSKKISSLTHIIITEKV